ncbi:MAG: ATP-binding protein [Oscillospiraceae bacterium]|nr:ATP-binding protein [Oscillospiraceae bacterium]
MIVSSVKFNGYKSFPSGKEYEIDISPSVTVFIGKNNCGKSSCIDVLETALMQNRFLDTKNLFNEIAVSFTVNSTDIGKYFSRYISGGRGISGSYYSYGSKYINQKIFGTLQVETSISNKQSVVLALKEDQKQINLPICKDNWTRLLHQHNNYQNKVNFRRLNADRDIVPEEETDDESLDFNGTGATNLLRKFVNNSSYDEEIVEITLLKELNKIMAPDSHFKNIRLQQIQEGDKLLWEIFLTEDNGKRFALSKSGSGLKTILLMLINLYVIPHTAPYKNKDIAYSFEELENNLHPALQRKIFEYLYKFAKENNSHIFITTHSHIAINTFCGKDKTAIYHVLKIGSESQLIPVENLSDRMGVLADLDVRASDLFQSNGIIWVEGPSDRVYINRWLQVFCNSEFIEGADYQFLYYGGRILAHYSANENAQSDLISILTTNRNAAIIIDSDQKSDEGTINDTKTRIYDEFSKIGDFCWITKGKEIENYIPAASINDKYGSSLDNVGQYELFPTYISEIDSSFSNHKVSFARGIVEHITKENSSEMLDLETQIKKLYESIQAWNRSF